MGIAGLLKELKCITEVRHLRHYKGQRAGVDVMCWMHQGIHCCIHELAHGEDTDKYVRYVMEFIKLLTDHEIVPLIVLDGRKLPAKRLKNDERRAEKEDARIAGIEAEANGDFEDADKHFKKSVGVTSFMIHKLIEELRRLNIEFIVAPYEADAQLAYLSINKLVDVVITQDSDAIVYGCSKTLFKLNKDSASGEEIARRNMGDAIGGDGKRLFANWTDDQFKLFACLAGSDYQSKLPNMGIKTAYKFAKEHKTFDNISRALKVSRFQNNVNDEFLIGLKQAWLTFKHQIVYDKTTKSLTHLNPVPESCVLDVESFLGEEFDSEKLHLLVSGHVNPHSLLPYTQELQQAAASSSSSSSSSSSLSLSRHQSRTTATIWGNGTERQKQSLVVVEEEEEEEDKNLWKFHFPDRDEKKPVGDGRGREKSVGKRQMPWVQNELTCNPQISSVFASNNVNIESPSSKQHSPQIHVNAHSKTWTQQQQVYNSHDASSPTIKQDTLHSKPLEQKRIDFFHSLISDEQSLAMATLPSSLQRKRRRQSQSQSQSQSQNVGHEYSALLEIDACSPQYSVSLNDHETIVGEEKNVQDSPYNYNSARAHNEYDDIRIDSHINTVQDCLFHDAAETKHIVGRFSRGGLDSKRTEPFFKVNKSTTDKPSFFEEANHHQEDSMSTTYYSVKSARSGNYFAEGEEYSRDSADTLLDPHVLHSNKYYEDAKENSLPKEINSFSETNDTELDPYRYDYNSNGILPLDGGISPALSYVSGSASGPSSGNYSKGILPPQHDQELSSILTPTFDNDNSLFEMHLRKR